MRAAEPRLWSIDSTGTCTITTPLDSLAAVLSRPTPSTPSTTIGIILTQCFWNTILKNYNYYIIIADSHNVVILFLYEQLLQYSNMLIYKDTFCKYNIPLPKIKSGKY